MEGVVVVGLEEGKGKPKRPSKESVKQILSSSKIKHYIDFVTLQDVKITG